MFWTSLLKKPAESAAANEDNLSLFMSKSDFFPVSMKVPTPGWDVQRQSVL